ncbi:unnamed protein product, partial [Discosporangium mesarthrocarpum]
LYPADLDGDRFVDLVSTDYGFGRVVWYQNNGAGVFAEGQNITSLAQGATGLFAADIDGDGDTDVLVASNVDNRVAWYNNTGTSWPETTITDEALGATFVIAADLDDDGDLDVVSASTDDNRIVVYNNMDGAGTFTEGTTISLFANLVEPRCVHAGDLDGDGDLDLLACSTGERRMVWFENSGKGNFLEGTNVTLAAGGAGPWEAFLGDVNNDNHLDIVVASTNPGLLSWLENDGSGGFTSWIIESAYLFANSVHGADMDHDGDLDILVSFRDNNLFLYYENNNGLGNFSKGVELTSVPDRDRPRHIYPADVDGDGFLDVVTTSNNDDRIVWYENL